jgi:hypothetical protein
MNVGHSGASSAGRKSRDRMDACPRGRSRADCVYSALLSSCAKGKGASGVCSVEMDVGLCTLGCSAEARAGRRSPALCCHLPVTSWVQVRTEAAAAVGEPLAGAFVKCHSWAPGKPVESSCSGYESHDWPFVNFARVSVALAHLICQGLGGCLPKPPCKSIDGQAAVAE